LGLDIDRWKPRRAARGQRERQSHAKLNGFVAVDRRDPRHLLGICNVKDDNVVQAMLAAQPRRIDQWNFYQARNIREEVMLASLEEMKLAKRGRTEPAEVAAYDEAIARYTAMARARTSRRKSRRSWPRSAQVRYDKLNYKDDQFDLAEASIAIAIALLAITALTHIMVAVLAGDDPERVRRRMIGVRGLLGLPFHPDFLIQPLT
jgi:hypothetical protein